MDTERFEGIRQHLARALREEDVGDEEWCFLVERRYIDEVVDGASSIQELAREVRSFRQTFRRPLRRSPGATVSVPADHPDASWLERAKAISDYHVALAERWPLVRRFRADVLANQSLTETEAYALLTSPAAQYFSVAELAAVGISPPRLLATVPTSFRQADEGELDQAKVIQVLLPTGPVELPIPPVERRKVAGDLEYPDERDRVRRIPVRRGSVLDTLRELSGMLASTHGWAPSQATWFALTGQPPLKLPLEARLNYEEQLPPLPLAQPRVTITMTIEPWMSSADVAAAYRFYQDQVFPSRPRPVGPKSLALFRFDLEQGVGSSEPPTWEERRLAWNRRYGDTWPYEDRRMFYRDTKRARKDLLDREYKLDVFFRVTTEKRGGETIRRYTPPT